VEKEPLRDGFGEVQDVVEGGDQGVDVRAIDGREPRLMQPGDRLVGDLVPGALRLLHGLCKDREAGGLGDPLEDDAGGFDAPRRVSRESVVKRQVTGFLADPEHGASPSTASTARTLARSRHEMEPKMSPGPPPPTAQRGAISTRPRVAISEGPL